MRSITRLLGAFGTLADSLLALAGVVDVATGKLRQQLAVEVIEHQPAGTLAPQELAENASAKRGRKSN